MPTMKTKTSPITQTMWMDKVRLTISRWRVYRVIGWKNALNGRSLMQRGIPRASQSQCFDVAFKFTSREPVKIKVETINQPLKIVIPFPKRIEQ